jgi:hypothetical protein
MKLPSHADFLPHEVSPFAEGGCLCSTGQHKRMVQPGNIEREEFSFRNQCPINHHHNSGWGEARIPERLGDPNGIEGFSGPGKHLHFSSRQVHVGTINAFQALEGFLCPSRSKGTEEAVNFNRRPHHLSRYRRGGKKAKQKQKP